jgi:hypothetical protein
MRTPGGYEPEGLIGRGSMGAVYRARGRAGGELVALKRVPWVGDHRVIEHLRDEAAALTRLDHTHVLKVLELSADEAGIAIAMELIDGGSLADLLGRRGRLPSEEGTVLAAKVADALAAAHAVSILHGDVKPSNILVDDAGEPLVADFGLARWTSVASPMGSATVGTAEYLDPEVAGGAPPTAASDIYSLGILCYEILTGRLPYHGVTPGATLRAADRARAEPLVHAAPSVPVDLAELVGRAMSRRRVARPSSAGELVGALRAATEAGHASTVAPRRVVPLEGIPTADGIGAMGPRTLRPRQRSRDPFHEVPPSPPRPRMPVPAIIISMGLAVLVLGRWAFAQASEAGPPQRGCKVTTSRPPQPADAGVVTMLADVAGDGCPVPVTWSSGVVTASLQSGRAPARFALGQPGDELLLGDWDCRRGARPALYRPATGQVFYFDAWAAPGHDVVPSAGSTTVRDGVPRVIREGVRGCDRVEVHSQVRPQT